MIPIDLEGKRALVMGVANSRSLGWAIAERLRDAGATLAFSYQGERLRADLEKLTQDIPGTLLAQCDVTNEADLSALFGQLKESWGSLDYVVHAIAFAPRPAMDGRYIETTKEDWLTALEISAYSLVSVARHAEPLWNAGGSMVTLSYYAAEKVVPKYNVMGIAKSALEASVRYLAHEMGRRGVRVNAVSAGPVRTVAARSIPGFMKMYTKVAGIAPLGRNVTH
ncbi:MAG TPA: enoyl-ACP reductase, partial [Thermoanaerobaculia bacterium]|nr:enoyl-ACP reductase [Thermoanaerobaculia bacterium]